MSDYHAITTLNEIREHSPCRDAQADSREYVGKPSEVRMAMEADGYDADQIAGHIRMARYDEATQFIRVTC